MLLERETKLIDGAHLVEWLPRMRRALGLIHTTSSPVPQKPGTMAYILNPSIWEVEAGRLEVLDHPWLHSSLRPAWATHGLVSKQQATTATALVKGPLVKGVQN